MIDIILMAFANAVLIQGVYFAFLNGQVFGGAGDFLRSKLGFWAKPLVSCSNCMSSVWGCLFLIYMHFVGLDLQLQIVPLHLLLTLGFSRIIELSTK